MNRKGQALVEFVLILPILIFLIFVLYDFGRIFNTRNGLENDSAEIVTFYKNGKAIEEIRTIYPDLGIELTNESEYDKLKISDKLKLITPGFNRLFGNPYKIEIVRYIPNE